MLNLKKFVYSLKEMFGILGHTLIRFFCLQLDEKIDATLMGAKYEATGDAWALQVDFVTFEHNQASRFLLFPVFMLS